MWMKKKSIHPVKVVKSTIKLSVKKISKRHSVSRRADRAVSSVSARPSGFMADDTWEAQTEAKVTPIYLKKKMKATRNIVGCKHLSCINLSKHSRQMNHSLLHRRKCNLHMNFVLFIWLWTFGLTTCLISTGIVLLNETLINSFYMWRRANPL